MGIFATSISHGPQVALWVSPPPRARSGHRPLDGRACLNLTSREDRDFWCSTQGGICVDNHWLGRRSERDKADSGLSSPPAPRRLGMSTQRAGCKRPGEWNLPLGLRV